jgi:DNA-binding response OmpR family regulator
MDDSDLVLEMTRQALEAAGYEVVTVASVRDFEAQRHEPLDLLVIDVQMPEAFGDDIASTLKAAYGVSTPILLFSTLTEAELASRAAEAGVQSYIPKSAGLAAFIAKVEETIRTHGS